MDAACATQTLSIWKQVAKPYSKPPTSVEVYELESNDSFGKAFNIYCLLEELHRIQNFLDKTWKSFKLGDIDLFTATIVINSAFDILRRQEEDALYMFGHNRLSYLNLSRLISSVDRTGEDRGEEASQ